MTNYKILIGLLAVTLGSQSYAEECRCKAPTSSAFVVQECPSVLNRSVPDAEAAPRFGFHEIDIENFLSLIGDFSGTRVCLSTSLQGSIYFMSENEMKWDDIIRSMSGTYGLKARVNSKTILVTGSLN